MGQAMFAQPLALNDFCYLSKLIFITISMQHMCIYIYIMCVCLFVVNRISYKSESVVALFKNESASNCVLRVGRNSNETQTDSITQCHPLMFRQFITCYFIAQSAMLFANCLSLVVFSRASL